MVALRKESVDRNPHPLQWPSMQLVALRKESVDRNRESSQQHAALSGSLSARRAWIEIPFNVHPLSPYVVALRKESVDRNTVAAMIKSRIVSRSPQGERG